MLSPHAWCSQIILWKTHLQSLLIPIFIILVKLRYLTMPHSPITPILNIHLCNITSNHLKFWSHDSFLMILSALRKEHTFVIIENWGASVFKIFLWYLPSLKSWATYKAHTSEAFFPPLLYISNSEVVSKGTVALTYKKIRKFVFFPQNKVK